MSDEMDGVGDNGTSPSEDGVGRRLPPPAFPPGSRKLHVTRKNQQDGEGVDGALISPDEPIPERSIATIVDAEYDPDEVTVTGMGHESHLEPEEVAMAGDPHVMKVSEVVSKLAAALLQKGEAGLRASPEMGRFEATLRGYCVGYLAGRRAEEDLPILEESERGSW